MQATRTLNLFFFAALLALPMAAWSGCDGAHLTYGGAIDSPLLDEHADITNQPALTLTGSALAGATVIIEGGAEPVETTADANGHFAADVDLRLDTEQRLEVRQTLDFRRSDPALADIEQDSIAPARPIVQWPSSPRRSPFVTLSGTTEADAHVMVAIDGNPVVELVADGAGHFECGAELAVDLDLAAEIGLEVWARDAAGNDSAPAFETIVFDPNADLIAPSLDPTDTYVSTPTIEVSGSADADVDVIVRSPRGEDRVRTGLDGAFTAEVALALNAENLIRAHAEDPGTGDLSAASTLTIIHDDIAPAAPILDPVADRVATPTVHVSGEAEAGATVRFDGPGGSLDTRASGSGHFDLDLDLLADAPTHYDCVAIDRAGNISAPTSLDVELDADLEGVLTLDPIDRVTADPSITIRGEANANAAVSVAGGASSSTTTAGADGRFVLECDLNLDRRNELHITTGDGAEVYVSVIHDGTAPILDLDPMPDASTEDSVRVSGETEANATIELLVNGHPDTLTSDASGDFSGMVDLGTDDHVMIDIRVVDQAGNTSGWTHHEMDCSDSDSVSPPTLSECPDTTSARTIRLTGYAEAGVDIEVTGAARVATAVADASGTFALDVELAANVVNDLELRAADGSLSSTPTHCSVEHDDVAPAAPDCDFDTLGLDLDLSLCVARHGVDLRANACVEAHAMVLIENMATGAQAWVQADAQGSVNASIGMCSEDELKLIQVDAAGNASAAGYASVR